MRRVIQYLAEWAFSAVCLIAGILWFLLFIAVCNLKGF
jgi:hypothetical protein